MLSKFKHRSSALALVQSITQHTALIELTTEGEVVQVAGHITRIVKLARDATAEIHASNQAKAALEAVSRSMAVIEFDLDGSIKQANANFLRTMAFKESDLLGQHHQILCEESFAHSAEYQDFWAQLQKGKFFQGQVLRRKRNGEAIWLEATYNPVLDTLGQPILKHQAKRLSKP